MDKPIRVVDKELLAVVRDLPCMACLPVYTKPSHPHHVTSRGAGGGDLPENLIPLCAIHHMEVHQIGMVKMFQKYPTVRTWLDVADRIDIIEKESLIEPSRRSVEDRQPEHGGRA